MDFIWKYLEFIVPGLGLILVPVYVLVIKHPSRRGEYDVSEFAVQEKRHHKAMDKRTQGMF